MKNSEHLEIQTMSWRHSGMKDIVARSGVRGGQHGPVAHNCGSVFSMFHAMQSMPGFSLHPYIHQSKWCVSFALNNPYIYFHSRLLR
ncbi:hypothetical protein RJT34_29744 [Clitoria ternatea]|uniref:Uncharacterized protein n=1 Tax=Clitoria ternatea TaxID=43366 RepID=A0AAN9ERI0_CLITE